MASIIDGRRLALLACLLAVTGLSAPFQPLTLRSQSGQFQAVGIPLAGQTVAGSAIVGGVVIPARTFAGSTSAVSFVRLDPALAVVSVEQIKRALLKELLLRDQWQGLISIAIHPVREDDEPVTITSVHHLNKWSYWIETPDQVNSQRFTKAIVQVLITELANRHSGSRGAELPPWLADGMAEHLDATSLAGLTLEPRDGISRKQRSRDPLASVRDSFRSNKPLTLDQLNWPGDDLEGINLEAFQNCAHLMVHELLHLKNGRPLMAQLIEQLHGTLNWQTTFFDVFGEHFPRLVDLDKWWALRLVQFRQGEVFSAFTPVEQWRQLENALEVRASVHPNPHELPSRTNLTLQQIIGVWDYAEQHRLLSQRMVQLRSVGLRSQAAVGQIIEEYWSALDTYVRKRGSPRRRTRDNPAAVQQAIERLNELDLKRVQMKRLIALPVSAQVERRDQ